MQRSSLTRFAWLSIAAALVTIALKTAAYFITGSVGLLSDAVESLVNLVGGIRGTAELEKLVNGCDYACAFSMFPTSIEDLMTIADAGGIMPPKSTWFEPKLRDAMFCQLI